MYKIIYFMKIINTLIAFAFLSNTTFAVDAYWKGTEPVNDVAQNTDWKISKFWIDGVVPNNTADVSYDVYFDVDKMPSTSFTSTGSVADMSGWDYHLTVNSVTVNGRAFSKINSGGSADASEAYINTIGDFTKLGAGTSVTICKGRNVDFNVSIGGNLVLGADKNTSGGSISFGGTGGIDTDWNGALKSLVIEKDIYLYNTGSLYLNVKSGNGSIDNTDVQIKGIVRALGITGEGGVWATPYISVMEQYAGTAGNSYIGVGGMTGHMVLLGVGGGTAYQGASTAYVVFNNAADVDVSMRGQIYDSYNKSNPTKLGLVMNGAGIQRITSDKLQFTGGVEVRNGTLSFDASKTMWNNPSYSESNHGDLIMRGGKLIFTNNQSEGVFGFDNFYYNGGIVSLNVNDYGMTCLSLAKTLQWGDAVTSEKVKFMFTGDVGYYLIGEENKAKIVSWELGNAPTDFENSDFWAENLTVLDQEYMAVFEQLSDGLYVYYTQAVPEPSTFAAMLGVLALGLVIYRKR